MARNASPQEFHTQDKIPCSPLRFVLPGTDGEASVTFLDILHLYCLCLYFPVWVRTYIPHRASTWWGNRGLWDTLNVTVRVEVNLRTCGSHRVNINS